MKRTCAIILVALFLVADTNIAWSRGFGGGGGRGFGGGGFGGGGFGGGGGRFGGGGFDRGGFDRGGFEQGGFDRGGFDRGGFDRGGLNDSGRFGGGEHDIGGYSGVRNYGSGSFGHDAINSNHPNWGIGHGAINSNHPNWGLGRITGNHAISAGHNLHNFDNNYMVNRGNIVRNNFYGFHRGYYGGFWNHGWWGRYPGCWYCPGWGMSEAWMITSWASMAGFLAMDMAMQPKYYGYGQDITYNNNQVYYNGQPYASAEQYYSQAQELAGPPPKDEKLAAKDWKPIGVFSMVEGEQTNSTMIFQLAINKNGELGGNYYDVLTDSMQPVHGKLDKKTQRVAWSIGSNQHIIYDTGMGNLMKEQAPVLVHFDKDRTQQWLMVRLKQPQIDNSANNQSKDSGDKKNSAPDNKEPENINADLDLDLDTDTGPKSDDLDTI